MFLLILAFLLVFLLLESEFVEFFAHFFELDLEILVFLGFDIENVLDFELLLLDLGFKRFYCAGLYFIGFLKFYNFLASDLNTLLNLDFLCRIHILLNFLRLFVPTGLESTQNLLSEDVGGPKERLGLHLKGKTGRIRLFGKLK